MTPAASARVDQRLTTSRRSDLLLGSDIATIDRGVHTLTGIAGEWRLYRVG